MEWLCRTEGRVDTYLHTVVHRILPCHVLITDIFHVLQSPTHVVLLNLRDILESHILHVLQDVRIRLPAVVVDFIHAQVNVLVRENISNLAEKRLEKVVSLVLDRVQDLCFRMLGIDRSEWHAIRAVAGRQQI